jgi:23S rRNA (cytosine1962-C5)-methyltransferase
MIITNDFKEYVILDTGDGMKLEKWKNVTLARPDPQVIWEKQRPELWDSVDAHYIRSSQGGGRWEFLRNLPPKWTVSYKSLQFAVRPTGFKHMGLFPEQAANWDYMMEKIRDAHRPVKVLNLFAYTGGATVACAAAGAEVVHVDAAKSMVAWAKENIALNRLDDKPVRFIVDDCIKFVLREQRRGNFYDAIIMDPPSYGRSDGGVFKVENDLYSLVCETAKLLSENPLFFILNSYTTGLSSVVCSNLLSVCIPMKGNIEAGDLCLPVEGQDIVLPCGTTTRWQR